MIVIAKSGLGQLSPESSFKDLRSGDCVCVGCFDVFVFPVFVGSTVIAAEALAVGKSSRQRFSCSLSIDIFNVEASTSLQAKHHIYITKKTLFPLSPFKLGPT